MHIQKRYGDLPNSTESLRAHFVSQVSKGICGFLSLNHSPIRSWTRAFDTGFDCFLMSSRIATDI